MTDRSSRFLGALLVAGLLWGSPGPGTAQMPVAAAAPDLREVSYLGFGYSASMPQLPAGGGVFRLMPSLGIGLYANARLSLSSPEGDTHFEEGMTPEEAQGLGDLRFQDEDAFRSANVGVIRPVTPGFALYGGLGYTDRRTFEEYLDPREGAEDRRGDFGFYWVEDEMERTQGVNFSAGFLIQVGRNVLVQGGGETFPRGFTVGAFLALPR